jgi:hypothetical protein
VDIKQAGVLVDALGTGYDDYTPEQRDQVIATFPRGDDFKSEFIELQTRSALKKPTTTFGTVNLEYIECRDPTFRRPQNVCARIRRIWTGGACGIQNNGWKSITKNSLLPGSLTSCLPGRVSPRRCAIGRATC